MNLLSKSDFEKSKTQERLTEIKEGAKLAQKIDLLRETFAKEEVNLAKFRNESLEKVKQEIMELLAEKQQLLREIEPLREEKLRIKQLLETL